MPAFSITPLTDIPPPAAQEFPNFLQFQEDGTDLGLSDADTLNFSTGLTATRGVGENANVVTVVATGGESSSYGVIELVSDPQSPSAGFFDGSPFPASWVDTETVPNGGWSFDGATAALTFASNGIYRVIATCTLTGRGVEGAEWPPGESNFGSTIGASQSTQFKTKVGDTQVSATWTDQYVISVSAAPESKTVQLYAVAISDGGWVVSDCAMTLVIERLGDLPA